MLIFEIWNREFFIYKLYYPYLYSIKIKSSLYGICIGQKVDENEPKQKIETVMKI